MSCCTPFIFTIFLSFWYASTIMFVAGIDGLRGVQIGNQVKRNLTLNFTIDIDAKLVAVSDWEEFEFVLELKVAAQS